MLVGLPVFTCKGWRVLRNYPLLGCKPQAEMLVAPAFRLTHYALFLTDAEQLKATNDKSNKSAFA